MTWKIRRYRRWCYFDYLPIIKIVITLVFFTAMLFLGFEAGSRVKGNFFSLPSYAAESNIISTWRIVGFREGDWKSILSEVLPVASYLPDYVEDESAGLIITAMKDITSADLTNPQSFFHSQIAYFDSVPVNAEPEFIPEEVTVVEPPAFEQETESVIIPDGTKPLVGIYCTHSAESYVPSQGFDRLEGKNGGVFLVAEHLKDTLVNNYGIAVVLSDTIHDYPDWNKSYANSLATLEKMKKDYPSIQLFIDVHRDALTPKDTTTTEIDGTKASKIMFVVGSDTRLPHPDWRENQDFVEKIAGQMEKMYPGLLKGVRVQDGRYNQHISPHAILLEMGGTENTLEETKRSAEMFAAVVNNLVKGR